MSAMIAAQIALDLGLSVGKFLLDHYLGKLAAAAGGGLLDTGKDAAKDAIKDVRQARKAEREYERVGEEVVRRIETDLQSAVFGMNEPRPDVNKIAERFDRILSGRLAVTFVVRAEPQGDVGVGQPGLAEFRRHIDADVALRLRADDDAIEIRRLSRSVRRVPPTTARIRCVYSHPDSSGNRPRLDAAICHAPRVI